MENVMMDFIDKEDLKDFMLLLNLNFVLNIEFTWLEIYYISWVLLENQKMYPNFQ